MRNDHIAFIIYPQYPFVGPVVPIAAVLVRRGYRVTFVTSDLFSSRASAVGAEVVPFSVPVYKAEEARTTLDRDNRESELARFIDNTLGQIEPFYQQNRPALILYDINAFAARVLLARTNIPAIQVSPTFAQDKENFGRRVPDAEFRKDMLAGSSIVDRVLRQFGVADSHDYVFYREKLNLYLFPKALQPYADSVDSACFFAGRCAGEQLHYGSWNRRNSCDMPIVLIATSTHYVRGPDYFKLWMEALKGLQWHVILSIGDSGDAASLGTLPSNFEIVQHTSHVKILPYASLLICLGGIVTSAEAAYHGVPLLVTSHGYPELEWQAEHLASLGIAVHLRKDEMDVENLRRAATQVVENTVILKKVEQMRDIVRREPGAEETANRIEEYLEACPR